MTGRERRVTRAAWLMRRDVAKAGDDLHEARLRAGLTLEQVAAAIGVSMATIWRTERAVGSGPRTELLAKHADAVGLRARVMLYPADDPLRDAPQLQLMREFRALIGSALRIDLERPVISVPGTSDRRAFDAIIQLPSGPCGVECYTRLHDCQAQVRAALLKQRDAGLRRLLLVVRGSMTNRRAVAATADLLRLNFPLGTRRILAALRRGEDPGANGLVFV